MNKQSIKPGQFSDEDIAVIGMAGRFPEADNLDQFWNNLVSGRHSVRDFPEGRKEELGKILGKVPEVNFLRQGYLDQISEFEPELFGINSEECKFMDPQQRILLELVEEAIGDAGYAPKRLAEREVGVFVTENENLYTRNFHGLSFMAFVNGLQSASSGRITYTYNFRGPAYMIGSACSSTLVALHAACESLRRGDCECAVSGGVRLDLFPTDQSQIDSVPILSPDQKVKAFDQAANGTIIGEGGAVLILKQVNQAIQDGEQIHGIIKSSGINSDGNRSSSLNSPSEEGQADAIRKAIKRGKIEPKSISYLEAHGTGTKIGDPIEISGITAALSQLGYPYQSVPIGSVKTNIGHLDTAAGIAGVVKIILAMKHQQIPPSLNFTQPNPFIDFERSPVYVNDRLRPWETDTVRRAGVTSLGLTGTNAHMILEEAPTVREKSPEWPQVVTLSTRTEHSMELAIERLEEHLQKHPEATLTDVAYTLNAGRRKLNLNLALTATSIDELRAKLASKDYLRYVTSTEGTYFQTVDGEVLEKGGEKDQLSPIYIYPDYNKATFEATRMLATTHPWQNYIQELNSQVQEPTTLEDPQVQYILNLYAYTQLLEDHSIEHGAALGFGLGEIVADLVLGDITLQEGIQQAHRYNQPEEKVEVERLARAVDAITEAGFNTFMLITPSDQLVQTFDELLAQRRGVRMYPFAPSATSLTQNLLQLLEDGHQIDWEQAYSKQRKQRLSLPTYAFDRKSYYLEISGYQQSAAALATEQDGEVSQPNSDPKYIEQRIRGYLQEFQPELVIQPGIDFESLGMDSVALMHFTGKIKQEFGVNIPLTLFFQKMTVGQILQSIFDLIIESTCGEFYISKQPEDTYLPMAHAQEVLFKMAQVNPWAGHIARAWMVFSKIDKARLEFAFKKIVQRHESLRTSFEIVDGELVQKVHSDVDFQVNYVKANLFTGRRRLKEQVHPFDLDQPPLLRVTLVEAGPISYLLYEVPYIIVDATSLHLLIEEFAILYEGGQLPELRIHQKDLVQWQRNQLQKPEMQKKARYWNELFEDGIHEINLPKDFQRPEVFGGTGARQEYWIKGKLKDQLNQLAKNQGVTMNMVLLAAYNILLAKYTDSDDVTIGTLMGGRSQEELERTIGHFAFIMPLRNQPTDDKDFIQFVHEVKENSLEAFGNQEYPIEDLMEEKQIQRGADRGPWFDSTFTYHNMTGGQGQGLGISLKMLPHKLGFWTVVEDFIIILMETDQGIMMDLRYSTQLFQKQTIRRFRNNYLHVLKAIVQDPTIAISEIILPKK